MEWWHGGQVIHVGKRMIVSSVPEARYYQEITLNFEKGGKYSDASVEFIELDAKIEEGEIGISPYPCLHKKCFKRGSLVAVDDILSRPRFPKRVRGVSQIISQMRPFHRTTVSKKWYRFAELKKFLTLRIHFFRPLPKWLLKAK